MTELESSNAFQEWQDVQQSIERKRKQLSDIKYTTVDLSGVKKEIERQTSVFEDLAEQEADLRLITDAQDKESVDLDA